MDSRNIFLDFEPSTYPIRPDFSVGMEVLIEKSQSAVHVNGRCHRLPMCNNNLGADVDICRPQSCRAESLGGSAFFENGRTASGSALPAEKAAALVGFKCDNDDCYCPDCQIKLIRLGNCFSCPLCGYGGCG